MKELVFLLEEPSMREVLNILLPQLLPQQVEFKLIIHKGKQDLEKAISYKLRRWQVPHIRFVIVRDQNSEDCGRLKKDLFKLDVLVF